MLARWQAAQLSRAPSQSRCASPFPPRIVDETLPSERHAKMEQGEGRRVGCRMQGRRGPITHCALGYLPVCCVCLPACQTAAALSNVKGALGGAGTDVKHLVKLTVYITSLEDLPAVSPPHSVQRAVPVWAALCLPPCVLHLLCVGCHAS